ncbi:GIY-YIG nuclease family protein [Pedobacter sp. AW31-3R]|uniref:GIY-YIG nuclease family protein n=1 Tax=Pedobacter sp. AW31-3R TaxID=3445781 RepID=UPI003FA0B596
MIIKHELTKEQESFIKKHKISDDLLIDAQGEEMSAEFIQHMSDTNKVIAYNTLPDSENDDHSLNFKTIGGHCPQRDPSKIALALRENKPGYIYLGGSIKGGLIKVGSTSDSKDRIKNLNLHKSKLAGFEDWEILYEARTENLGKLERILNQKLSEYKATYEPEKIGKVQNGSELYRCAYAKVKDLINTLEEENQISFTQVNERKHLLSEYQFKNLKSRATTRV